MRGSKRICPKCLAKVKGGDVCAACGHELAPLGADVGERQLPDWSDVLPAAAPAAPSADDPWARPDAAPTTPPGAPASAPGAFAAARPAVPPPPAPPIPSSAPSGAGGTPAPKAGWSPGQRLVAIVAVGLGVCLVVGGLVTYQTRQDDRASLAASTTTSPPTTETTISEQAARLGATRGFCTRTVDQGPVEGQPAHQPGAPGQYAIYDDQWRALDDGGAVTGGDHLDATTLAICPSPIEEIASERTCPYIEVTSSAGGTPLPEQTVPGTEADLPVALARVRLDVYELRTGEIVGSGEAVADIDAECPDRASTSATSVTIEVTPEVVDAWIAAHLSGGSFR